MNLFKKIVFLAFAGIVLFSCEKATKTSGKVEAAVEKTGELAVNIKKVSLDIEGMTCEIGCARLIQSKLSKADGVTTASVNFEEKKGVVEFDANKIDESKIIAVVQAIAGGDLYKVTGTELIEKTTE